MRRSLVIGNWKMNGSRSQQAQLLADLLGADISSNVDVAVCPAALYIGAAVEQLSGSAIGVGSQNVAAEVSGAFTGEIAAPMLADIGCKYALVGHSERRSYYGETSEQVAAKASQLINVGITPVVCVGETKQQREANETLQVIEQQLQPVFDAVKDLAVITIAYEPVWAIGTGLTATPAQAQEVHAFIRSALSKAAPDSAQAIRLLYGGSVKANNAEELFSQCDIDGGLIGGASLDANEFGAIINSAG